MNAEVSVFSIIGEIFMSISFICFLPLGIYILFNLNDVEEKFMAFARRNAGYDRPEYIYVFGRLVKSESPKWWNLIVLRLIGGVAILMGSVMLLSVLFKLF